MRPVLTQQMPTGCFCQPGVVMHPYEAWILRRYLVNVLKAKFAGGWKNVGPDLAIWLKAERAPGLTFSSDRRRNCATRFQRWQEDLVAAADLPAPKISPLQARINWIADACGLKGVQRMLLGLFVHIARVPDVVDLVAAVSSNSYRSMRYDFDDLRPFFGAPVARRELSETGLLVRVGLLQVDSCSRYGISDVVEMLIDNKRLTRPQIRDLLLGKRATPTLGWEDFAHLGSARELAARLVSCVWTTPNDSSANILLYGAPGTGKSEFVKTLGAHLGYPVYFVGEGNDKGTEPARQERIASLMIANAMGATTKEMIVAVDEADDLFAGVDEDNAATRQGSRVFMHRLVERARAPTVWIVNDVRRLGPAVVRRMNLVVRFPRPGKAVRRKIVERLAVREKIVFDDHEVHRIAGLPAAPALIENAIRSTARICGSSEDALQILGSGLKAMGHDEIMPATEPIDFDPALSRADVDLRDLMARIKAAPSKCLSFCLSGPPGTGKSAYARYLARELGLEVLEKRYSDLVSSYLGESEKAIAAAFEEAADLGAFLILDEADSLLRNRGAARYSWEITQVNEMLTWMERHPLPFACTTNAPDMLDPATARRFLFKIQFLPMDAGQIAAAFKKAFGTDAPTSILKLDLLTPGDFAVVVRKAAILGERDPARLGRWLEEEAAAKPEGRKARIGF